MAETSPALRIALVGPGAIGCTIVAHLSALRRHALFVCARTPLDRIELATTEGLIVAEPAVLTEPSAATPVDWVLVATKAYDTAGAARWLAALCGPQTRVAVLQNGVEHRERFASLVSADRLVPVVIDCPAERSSPGRVRQRGPATQLVPNDAAGEAYAQLFAATPVRTTTTADWKTAAWRKLCINSPGALSAVLLAPSRIARDDGVAELMRGMIREVIAVGRAEGAVLDDAIVEQVVAGTRGAPPDSMNSLHADRAANRPMEVDARNGVIVRLGKKHGIPTPLNAWAATLLNAVAPA